MLCFGNKKIGDMKRSRSLQTVTLWSEYFFRKGRIRKLFNADPQPYAEIEGDKDIPINCEVESLNFTFRILESFFFFFWSEASLRKCFSFTPSLSYILTKITKNARNELRFCQLKFNLAPFKWWMCENLSLFIILLFYYDATLSLF